jgi:hypothetical protein
MTYPSKKSAESDQSSFLAPPFRSACLTQRTRFKPESPAAIEARPITEIQCPPFAIAEAWRRAPLPAGQLDRGFDAIGALTVGASDKTLKSVDSRQSPILESTEC